LEDRTVLAIDGDDFRSGFFGDVQEQFASDDQGFFVGQCESFSAFNGSKTCFKSSHTNDSRHNNIDLWTENRSDQFVGSASPPHCIRTSV
jgi:hypothetical protein